MVCCEAAFALVFLVIRVYLSRENAKRENEKTNEQEEDAYIVVTDKEGVTVKEKVDKVCTHYPCCLYFTDNKQHRLSWI